MVLQPQPQNLLRGKLARNGQVGCDDTNVIVAVSARTEHEPIKRFDDLSIDWVNRREANYCMT